MSDEDNPRPAKKVKVQNTSAASTYFTKASEKPRGQLQWHIVKETLLAGVFREADVIERIKACSESSVKLKLATFDLDGTLIKNRSGARFPRDETDWTFFDSKVLDKLRNMYENGYHVVIFSNQAGFKLTESAKRYSQFKAKIKALTETLKVPLHLYAATAHDQFRKPRIGMYHQFLEDFSQYGHSVAIDETESFFVGDAAGRPFANARKDFSASDRKFAINAELKFYTPEEFFLSRSTESFELTGFDPSKFENPGVTAHLFARTAPQEIVLFVGPPAAGKSTYFKTYLEPLAYRRINQDTLKTRQKCIAKAREELVAGNSVCIDNTNANIETRAHWLQLAKEIKEESSIPVRVVHFTADVQLCEHNNAVRAFVPKTGDEKRELLPTIAFTSFTGRYEPPKMGEGFSSIDTVDFILRGTEAEQKTWRQYWT